MHVRRWGEGKSALAGGCAAACLVVALAFAAPAAAASPEAHASAVGPAPPAQRLQLVLPLVARDGGLAQLAQAVATPGSPRYGQFESVAALARRFGAKPQVRERVLRYLRAHGATGVRIDTTGLFADATFTAARAARLFATPLTRFRARQSTFVAPAGTASIPSGLRGSVWSVVGLDTRTLSGAPTQAHAQARRATTRAYPAGQPSSAFPRTGTPSGCMGGLTAGEQDADSATAGFTPNQYLSAYGFDQLHRDGLDGQGERVALIEIDGYRASDIDTFAQCFNLHVPPMKAYGAGVRHRLAPGGESTLDLEALDAAAPGLKAIDVYETNANAAGTLQALTAPLQNRHRHPQVISASLGLCEPAVFGAVGIRGIQATEDSLEMAAISGTTILAASGDSGSADCIDNSGFPIGRLAVNYPASSDWVTAVGGTNLLLGPTNQITDQVVWNDTNIQPGSAGGGGSSELFYRPFYQAGVTRPSARALPDVSMLADILPGYAVYCTASGDCLNSANSDPWQAVGGTSASTPLLAGGFALIDQDLRMHQRQDLGLANPLLYQLGRSSTLTGQVFDDITSYGNDVGAYVPGDGQPLGCCTAAPGYDRASGWGSINLARLAPVALSLQPAEISLSLPAHQRPLARHEVITRMSCTGGCRIGAYVELTLGRKQYVIDSRIYRLRAAGSKRIPIRLSGKMVGRVRSARAGHERVTATVYGVTIAGRARVEFQTGGRRIRLSG